MFSTPLVQALLPCIGPASKAREKFEGTDEFTVLVTVNCFQLVHFKFFGIDLKTNSFRSNVIQFCLLQKQNDFLSCVMVEDTPSTHTSLAKFL